MTLITGGSKCGKSSLAEKLLDRYGDNKYYIATMQPFGEEAFAAIDRHRKLRAGKGFVTIERYTGLAELDIPSGSRVLLECMANLCANEMFGESGINDPEERIMRGIGHLRALTEELVIVTNNVGSDGIDYGAETNGYIRVLGRINARLAAAADCVVECVYGIPAVLKGRLLL